MTPRSDPLAESLRLRACTVDLVRAEVRREDGRAERLTPREADLLGYLARHGDRVVTRDELLERVWGYAPTVVTRVVDTTVRRLREKIEAHAQQPDHVITAFGEGYRFVAALPPPVVAPPSEPEEEPFVGRHPEVARLLSLLGRPGASAVLLGPPGAGKTRIARHLAWRLSELQGGTVFVDATETRDLPQVATACALALGIEAGEDGDRALRRTGVALRGRGACLVVLDNCEGVAGPVTVAIAAWREAAPQARFLATSRARIEGAHAELAIGALSSEEGIELFEVLARRVRPDLTVEEEGRGVVRELVDRLEGIPLAIALAAGRAGAMSPRAILDRLHDRFRLLASRSRDGEGRHRTLTASLDASWDLLGPDERMALAACAAFRGGFDREAAEAVIAHPDTDALLAALCSRSLLERRGPRFGSYAFVREYAGARLAGDPALELAVFDRHARLYALRCDAAPPPDRGQVLSPDRGNLLAATERAGARGWTDLGVRTGLGALDVLAKEGPFELAIEVTALVLALPGLPVSHRALVAIRRATLEIWTGRGDVAATLDLAEAEARESGDPALVSGAVRARGMWLRRRGRQREAVPILEEAVRIARQGASFDALSNAMSTLGLVLRELGRIDDAHAVWQELVERAAQRGDLTSLAHATGNLALVARRLGRFDEARRLYEQALGHVCRTGDRRGEAVGRSSLGNLAYDLGALEEARAWYLAALKIYEEIALRDGEGTARGGLGLVARALGDHDEARTWLGSARQRFLEVGDLRHALIAAGNLGELELADGRPGPARDLLAQATEELGALGDHASEAELLPPLAEALLALGHVDAAEERIAQAEALAREVGNPLVLAQVLARRGLVERARGRDASATLAEAQVLAQAVGLRSDTGRAVARLRAAIGG